MTDNPSGSTRQNVTAPSSLVERVAAAIRDASYGYTECMDDMRTAQARAAIRVVVNQAITVCDERCEACCNQVEDRVRADDDQEAFAWNARLTEAHLIIDNLRSLFPETP